MKKRELTEISYYGGGGGCRKMFVLAGGGGGGEGVREGPRGRGCI